MNILIPDSWLREYLDTKATPEKIKEYLSLCGPTIDRINRVGNDYIYDIEITSNRVDMASVYGIAREAAAILPKFGIKASLKELPSTDNLELRTNLSMDISDPEKICHRILGIVMEVDPMKPSPDYIKNRLESSGIRALNNLVDITNYIMLEVGHPSHVFDYDRISTHKFIIRKAKKNEPIITLDNKKYLLNEEDVIIDDGTGRVIDLPGIMGTENSVVKNSTRRIIFFIESNNPIFIRKTSMRYGIRTMAAAINEKHPDPELAKIAMLRGIELFQKIAGGKLASHIIDIYPNPPKPNSISVSIDFINDRLGIKLNKAEIIDILQSLSFRVGPFKGSDPYQLKVTPPSFRQFDVTIPEDIVEEVARIYGYHNLPAIIMDGLIPLTLKPKDLPIEEKIKTILKYWGYVENYHYSFISKDLIVKSGLKIEDHLKVANPLTPDTEYMRINLLPSMLQTINNNQSHYDNLQLFELSKIYIPRKNDLPNELSMLTITNQDNFYRLKGIVEGLLKELGIQNIITKTDSAKQSPFFHPQQTLAIYIESRLLATLGKLHPALSNNFGIKKDTYIAYLNVENLVRYYNPLKKFTPISPYPPIIEDISIKLPAKTYLGPIINSIYKISSLIRKIELADKFKDTVTLRLTFQSDEKNLTNEEIDTIKKHLSQTVKSI